jgi:PPM family protein phosphatase
MLEAFGISDPGSVRSNNEDYFISDSRLGIFILADGMGGAAAGEYASRLSAEKLYDFLLNAGQDGEISTLEQGFTEANQIVRQASVDNPEFDGMGTTLIAARVIDSSKMQLASVGDSRVYLLCGDELTVLTKDHTWISEVGTRLGLSDEALRKHPMRHVLTMAIGVSTDIRIDSQVVDIAPGDQILLCSDGLHGVVDENVLRETLKSEHSLPQKAHLLIEAAKQQGGPDNVTVVLVRVL